MFPAAAVGVDGEGGSKIEGTRGASPADGRPATASSSAAHFKAFVRWSPLRSLGVRRPDPVTSGAGFVGSSGEHRGQGSACNFSFSEGPLCKLGGTVVIRILV